MLRSQTGQDLGRVGSVRSMSKSRPAHPRHLALYRRPSSLHASAGDWDIERVLMQLQVRCGCAMHSPMAWNWTTSMSACGGAVRCGVKSMSWSRSSLAFLPWSADRGSIGSTFFEGASVWRRGMRVARRAA